MGSFTELSIREAEPSFAEAATAAGRGERVIVTKRGRPFIGLVPAWRASGMNFEKAAIVSCALGRDSLKVGVPPYFDDSVFNRQMLGLGQTRHLTKSYLLDENIRLQKIVQVRQDCWLLTK